MKQEEFKEKARSAAKAFADRKKVATKPDTQFVKGAMWAWQLLYDLKLEPFYEEQLRRQIESREGKEAEQWMDSIIETTAKALVDLDETRQEIRRTGRTWESWDKNMNPKRESCPHITHEKDILRTLDLYYQSLGLSYKTTPKKMTDNVKKGGAEVDKLGILLNDLNNIT